MAISAMEPLMPPEGGAELEASVLDLRGKADALTSSLHPVVRRDVAELVRMMNCYYSNLIEGHKTYPREIASALEGNFSGDTKNHDLQLEAKAHVEVQRMIDAGLAPSPAASVAFVCWAHREFYARLPESMHWVENTAGHPRVRVIPGEFRTGRVVVGAHHPPEPGDLGAFMGRWESAYAKSSLGPMAQVFAAGAAHHRLVWIHPFFDGNGRVARLMSDAMFRELGMAAGLWAVSRGLARTMTQYRAQLANADRPREGDFDGRGNLSARGLESFAGYFLMTAVDQVTFMGSILQPSHLLERVNVWVKEEVEAKRLSSGTPELLAAVVREGEIDRNRVASVIGYGERHGRVVTSRLLKRGLLVADGVRGPLRLGYPMDVVERWFPTLYPEIGPAPKLAPTLAR